MRTALLNQRRVVTAVAVLLLIAGLVPSSWAGRISDVPQQVVRAALTPLRHPLNALGDVLRPGRDVDVDLGDDESIKQQLIDARVDLERAKADLAAALDLIQKLTGIRNRFPRRGMDLLPATVTDGTIRHQRLALDKGQRDGVKPRMAVADGDNLIGRVSRVTASGADVRPIVAAGTRLAVLIAPARSNAAAPPVQATIDAAGDGRGFVGRVDANAAVKAGDWAFLDDREWPDVVDRFIIGVVVEVTKDERDPALRRRVRIETIPSLARLRVVVVVIPTVLHPTGEAP